VLIGCPSRSQTSETLLPQTAVLDEPDTLDTFDLPIVPNEDNSDSDSSVEILDGGSDVDIDDETELTTFSKMLCDAQKKALAVEKAMGNKRKTHNGHSRTTAYRRKRHRSDLATQGYLPVHEFMKRMEEQKKEEKLTASQKLTLEESEESSDNDVIALTQLRSDEPSMSEGMDIEELAPAAIEARHQTVQGPAVWGDHRQVAQGPAASEGRRQVAQGPAASEERRQVVQLSAATEYCYQIMQGPAASEDRRQVVQGPVTSEGRRQAPQGLPEEEEESSGSEDEDIANQKKHAPGDRTFRGSPASCFDGVRGIVSRLVWDSCVALWSSETSHGMRRVDGKGE